MQLATKSSAYCSGRWEAGHQKAGLTSRPSRRRLTIDCRQWANVSVPIFVKLRDFVRSIPLALPKERGVPGVRNFGLDNGPEVY